MQIWCAVTLLTSIKNRVVLPRLVHLTGTVAACRQAVQELNAARVARLKLTSQVRWRSPGRGLGCPVRRLGCTAGWNAWQAAEHLGAGWAPTCHSPARGVPTLRHSARPQMARLSQEAEQRLQAMEL